MKATIFEIKRFAVHDGDGIRTTVFFKGCPLRCVWCHNPEGLTATPQEAFYEHKCIGCGECGREGFTVDGCLGEARQIYGKEVDVDGLLSTLLEDRDFYGNSGGGVTLSGGECLTQWRFAQELLLRLKEEGINTAVDTCGFVSREAIDGVAPYTDVFLYDLKAYSSEVHEKCTGQPNGVILENLKYLDSIGKRVEIRIPYVPDYNDTEIEDIARFLSTLRNIVRVRVLPYHSYAATKYRALGMECNLPKRLPSDGELTRARSVIGEICKLECL